MEASEFKEWLENPVTQYFLKYLEDSAKEEAEGLKDTILSGSIPEIDTQMRVVTICATLNGIAHIDHQEIETFYE